MSDYYDKVINSNLERLNDIAPSDESLQRSIDAAREVIMEGKRVSNFGFSAGFFFKAAVAAAIIAAVCVGIVLLNSQSRPVPDKEIVKPAIENDISPSEENNSQEHQELEALYAAGDTEALIDKLSSEDIEIASAAAGYLAETDDMRAVAVLENLADKWSGQRGDTFRKAIEQIKSNSKPDADDPRKDTPGEQPAVTSGDENPAEPNAVESANAKKEYKKPQNVHGMWEQVSPEGTTVNTHKWIKLPDCYKEIRPDKTTIDNGTERLVLDHEAKTARFEDSWQSVHPLSEDSVFQYIEAFRKGLPGEAAAKKIKSECTEQTNVYDIAVTHRSKAGKTTESHIKAWVDADSLLVLKFETVNPENDPNTGNYQKETNTFDYSQIADSVFEMKVPAGYKLLDRKQRQTFSGRVVDESGNPVAGARVLMQNVHLGEDDRMETHSDKDGFFIFTMSPNFEGLWDSDPVCFWAFSDEDPDHVAWTLLRSKKQTENEKGKFSLATKIPPHQGNLEICERYEKGGPWLKSASGIVLQMQKAGKIFGFVSDSLGNPVSSAKIKVSFKIFNKLGHTAIYGHDLWPTITYTDDQGCYTAGNLPLLETGTNGGIEVSAKGYNSRFAGYKLTKSETGKQVVFELLITGVSVSGTLIDNYGNILADRRVSVSSGKGNLDVNSRTDENGTFLINDCPITENFTVTAELSEPGSARKLKDLKTYQFYSNVSKEITIQEDRMDYEVDFVAVMPENTVEVEVVDSDGQPLPYFPVEIVDERWEISSQWRRTQLEKRTDSNGKCTFAGVPDVERLKVRLNGSNTTIYDDDYDREIKDLFKELREEYSKMRFTEIPLEITDGCKHYKIRAEILTQEEYRRKNK